MKLGGSVVLARFTRDADRDANPRNPRVYAGLNQYRPPQEAPRLRGFRRSCSRLMPERRSPGSDQRLGLSAPFPKVLPVVIAWLSA
jgi:hypothetical protein